MEKEKAAPQERGAEKKRGNVNARVMEVIAVVTAVGSGTETDPKRYITEFWSVQGELLAVRDPQPTRTENRKTFEGTFCVMKNNEEAFGGSFTNAQGAADLIERYGQGKRVEVIIHAEHEEMGRVFSSSASQ